MIIERNIKINKINYLLGIEINYKDNGSFMNNIIYLYNQFPFLNYIKEITYTKENKISEIMYISKQEILNYIKKNNIKLDKFNENTCICPLLYK